MNFSDERYVRLFTRDTVSWRRMPWQARAVFLHLLRKVDRAGVLEGVVDLVPDLAAVLDLPEEVVAPGIAHLVSGKPLDNPVFLREGSVTLPKFLEAQECSVSDASRKRRSREARRAVHMGAPPDCEGPHTIGCNNIRAVSQGCTSDGFRIEKTSDSVTSGHTESQAVTLNHPETRRDKTNQEGDGAATPAAPAAPASAPEGFGPEPVTSVRQSRRGTRLPADWRPKPETVAAFARDGLDALAAVPEFIDHWTAIPGSKGCKLDWEATFRNRIRQLTDWGRAPRIAGGSAGSAVVLQRGVKLQQAYFPSSETADEKAHRLEASKHLPTSKNVFEDDELEAGNG